MEAPVSIEDGVVLAVLIVPETDWFPEAVVGTAVRKLEIVIIGSWVLPLVMLERAVNTEPSESKKV